MVNLIRLLSVVLPVAAAATLVAGYSYMEERERTQEHALLKALEEMSKVLAEETCRWEEWQLSQERRIHDILQIERRLEEVEAEQKRVRRERREERLLPPLPAAASGAPSRGIEVSSAPRPPSLPYPPAGTTGADFTPEKEPSVCKLTLDLNTAHRNLALAKNLRMVTRVPDFQSYPPHPDRFDYWEQVLCKEGLMGRCYWEAVWTGRVSIAMAYKGIHRRGEGGDCGFGYNDKSWSLECYRRKSQIRCSVRHNRKTTELPVDVSGANRVGVYLDSAAGKLSFYSIASDAWTHLYTFRAEFTEPLYPGFMFGPGSSVSCNQIESA